MNKLKPQQILKIDETFKDFKCLLERYRELKNDSEKLNLFFVRNRNPIWDITNIKFFKTGLKSELSENKSNDMLVDDHFIQRSKSLRLIFQELDKNENINLNDFIILVKKLCSTVKLTKDEHTKVTLFAKKNPDSLNYETYIACGIKVNGLSDFILK